MPSSLIFIKIEIHLFPWDSNPAHLLQLVGAWEFGGLVIAKILDTNLDLPGLPSEQDHGHMQ